MHALVAESPVMNTCVFLTFSLGVISLNTAVVVSRIVLEGKPT